MDASTIEDALQAAGHLHLYMDSGAEFSVLLHDVSFDGDTLVIDSKQNHWTLDATKVEYFETEPSGREEAA